MLGLRREGLGGVWRVGSREALINGARRARLAVSVEGSEESSALDGFTRALIASARASATQIADF